MPRCSVVVVTYNSSETIETCLAALGQQDCEIVVVDNASVDDTVRRVQALAPTFSLQLLPLSRNLGFAGGVNHGVGAASGDVLLVLNPDAIAEPGAIAALLACFDSTGASAAGGALLEVDGQPARGFTFRRLPSIASLLCEVLLINHVWKQNPINRRYRCLDANLGQLQDVEQPAGACLAVTRKTWDAALGMDADFYPVWFEDVDFCKRLRDSRARIIYCPAARFRHSGAHSVGRLAFRQKQLYWYQNMLRYTKKHFSSVGVMLLRLGIIAGMTLRSLAAIMGAGPHDGPVGEALAAYGCVAALALGFGQRAATAAQR